MDASTSQAPLLHRLLKLVLQARWKSRCLDSVWPCESLQALHQEDEETSTSAEETCSRENFAQKRAWQKYSTALVDDVTLRALAEVVLAKV